MEAFSADRGTEGQRQQTAGPGELFPARTCEEWKPWAQQMGTAAIIVSGGSLFTDTLCHELESILCPLQLSKSLPKISAATDEHPRGGGFI